MLEPPHLLSFGECRIAGKNSASGIFQVKQDIKKMQTDACYQDGGDRHQRYGLPVAWTGPGDSSPNEGSLIFAKQFLYPSQGNRIHIPGIAREIPHLLDRAIRRSMKPVVHAGGQAQGFALC